MRGILPCANSLLSIHFNLYDNELLKGYTNQIRIKKIAASLELFKKNEKKRVCVCVCVRVLAIR